MKHRSPIAVFLLGLVTFGFYSWYWAVKTKGEMNKLGENIPTAWMWLIPFVGGIWWYWRYSEGVEHVTRKELNWVVALLVLLLLSNIGQAIVQDFFNKVEPVSAGGPVANPGVQPAAFSAVDQNSSTPPYQQPPTQPPSIPPIAG